MKKITLPGMILLAALGISTADSYAQDRNREQPRDNKPGNKGTQQQAKKPNNLGTVKRNDAHFKKEKAKVVATRQKPQNAEKVVHNNRSYEYSNGKFYIHNNGRYIPAAPPRGARIKHLPPSHVKVTFGNIFYYFFDGIFYEDHNGYYEVVYPEIGTIVDALPSDYEKVVYNGNTYYEYNGILYEKIRTIHGKGYQVVGYLD